MRGVGLQDLILIDQEELLGDVKVRAALAVVMMKWRTSGS